MKLRVDLARLNHVLIPERKADRDRYRKGWLGRVGRPFGYLYEALTPEGQLVLLLSCVSGAFGIDAMRTDTHLLWALLLASLGAALVVARVFALRGAHLDVALPARVAVGERIAFELTVHNAGPREHQALRFFGPFLPWDGRWDGALPRLSRLPPGARATVSIYARFRHRGEHHLDPFRVAALGPFALALGPSLHTEGTRFLVVPRIARVLRVQTALGRRHQPGGIALASKTGESMDLLGVRPYRAGDPVRDLHAKSWARTGVPVVREYQQEYFSRVGVVLDTDLTASNAEALEAALSLAAGIVARLTAGEALIDLLVVGRAVHTLMLGRSLGTLEQALDLLACVEPGPTFSVNELLGVLAPHLGRLSSVVFIALSWDDERRALEAHVESVGVGLTSVLVGAEAPGVRSLTCETIHAQRDIVL